MAVLSTPDRSEAPRVSRPKAVVLASNNSRPGPGQALFIFPARQRTPFFPGQLQTLLGKAPE
jgi:hypothetical protein